MGVIDELSLPTACARRCTVSAKRSLCGFLSCRCAPTLCYPASWAATTAINGPSSAGVGWRLACCSDNALSASDKAAATAAAANCAHVRHVSSSTRRCTAGPHQSRRRAAALSGRTILGAFIQWFARLGRDDSSCVGNCRWPWRGICRDVRLPKRLALCLCLTLCRKGLAISSQALQFAHERCSRGVESGDVCRPRDWCPGAS